jgi:formylglycine-generating enzyme required for sulfatase activity
MPTKNSDRPDHQFPPDSFSIACENSMTTKCHYKIHVPRGDGTILPITFQKIPACLQGFRMGSRYGQPNERPVHRVCIPYDFWLSTTPVTQQQFACWTDTDAYQQWRESNNEDQHKNVSPGLQKPADSVNYHHASAFCDWLNQFIAVNDGLSTRLPYEAEWEYACNAGEESAYHTGDGEMALTQAGWYMNNRSNMNHEVQKKEPNHFGLHDLHGNVWEWCQDYWDDRAYRRRWDGITPEDAYKLTEKHGDKSTRMLRGGSWFTDADNCRAAYRDRDWARGINGDGGLRVCLAPSADQSKSSDA